MKTVKTLSLIFMVQIAMSVDVTFPDLESKVVTRYEGVERDVYLGAFARGYLEELGTGKGGSPLYNGAYGPVQTRGYGHGVAYAAGKKLANGDEKRFSAWRERVDAELVKVREENGEGPVVPRP